MLKSVWTDFIIDLNGQFYYIKSWILEILVILLYKMTPFTSRQFFTFGAESSSRTF